MSLRTGGANKMGIRLAATAYPSRSLSSLETAERVSKTAASFSTTSRLRAVETRTFEHLKNIRLARKRRPRGSSTQAEPTTKKDDEAKALHPGSSLTHSLARLSDRIPGPGQYRTILHSGYANRAHSARQRSVWPQPPAAYRAVAARRAIGWTGPRPSLLAPASSPSRCDGGCKQSRSRSRSAATLPAAASSRAAARTSARDRSGCRGWA
jgi:hypothetical protein